MAGLNRGDRLATARPNWYEAKQTINWERPPSPSTERSRFFSRQLFRHTSNKSVGLAEVLRFNLANTALNKYSEWQVSLQVESASIGTNTSFYCKLHPRLLQLASPIRKVKEYKRLPGVPSFFGRDAKVEHFIIRIDEEMLRSASQQSGGYNATLRRQTPLSPHHGIISPTPPPSSLPPPIPPSLKKLTNTPEYCYWISNGNLCALLPPFSPASLFLVICFPWIQICVLLGPHISVTSTHTAQEYV